jgi:hypothetical protein
MKATFKLASLLLMSSMLFTACGSRDNSAPDLGQPGIESNGLGLGGGWGNGRWGQGYCMEGATSIQWRIRWFKKTTYKYKCVNRQWKLTHVNGREVSDAPRCTEGFLAERKEVGAAISKLFSATTLEGYAQNIEQYEPIVKGFVERNRGVVCSMEVQFAKTNKKGEVKTKRNGEVKVEKQLYPVEVNTKSEEHLLNVLQDDKAKIQVANTSECSVEIKNGNSQLYAKAPTSKKAWKKLAKEDKGAKLKAFINEIMAYQEEHKDVAMCTVTNVVRGRSLQQQQQMNPAGSVQGLLNTAKSYVRD